MRWNGRGELECPLRGQSLESRLAAQRSVLRTSEWRVAVLDPRRRRWCSVFRNHDAFFVVACSGWRSTILDPAQASFVYPITVSPNELGEGILRALAASRFVDPRLEPEFFEYQGRADDMYSSWVADIMRQRGYRKRQLMFGAMRLIQIEQDDETITIRPTNHHKLEAWSGKSISAEHRAILPGKANANECGSAALSALERCM